jgi:hypothetical protein
VGRATLPLRPPGSGLSLASLGASGWPLAYGLRMSACIVIFLCPFVYKDTVIGLGTHTLLKYDLLLTNYISNDPVPEQGSLLGPGS